MALDGTEQSSATTAGAPADAAGSESAQDFSFFGKGPGEEDVLSGHESGGQQPGNEGLDTQQPAEPEMVEVEYEGAKYKVPAPLKDGVMRQSDYTRKTTDVAEARRTLEQREQQFEEQANTHRELVKDFSRFHAIDERLQQLGQMDLQALNAQNPQQAQAVLLELNQLQALRGQVVGSLTQKQQQLQTVRQQAIAKQIGDADAFLKREFKDWSPAKDHELGVYAESAGLNRQELGQFMLKSPGIMVVLNKAAQWDKFLKEKAKTPPPKKPEPGTRVGGGQASNTKPLSQVTDPKEWAERRAERKGRNR